MHAPMWPFVVAAVIFEATFSPLGLKPPLHRRRLDFFRKSFFFSNSKAQELLGFTPQVGFARAPARPLNGTRSNGYL